jgi:hypothetical protein
MDWNGKCEDYGAAALNESTWHGSGSDSAGRRRRVLAL